MKRIVILLFAVVLLVLFNSVMYDKAEWRFIPPGLKTINVEYFENNAPAGCQLPEPAILPRR